MYDNSFVEQRLVASDRYRGARTGAACEHLTGAALVDTKT